MTPMIQVGVYLRISEDPDGSQQATVRQLEDCGRYAASRGWNVAEVFEDVDVSAFQRTAKRPEFERMIRSVRDRSIDGVLTWKMDRLSRRMLDFVRVDDAAEAAGAFICSVQENINTQEATGRFVAELLTAQARMESANISTRVKRAHEQMAKQGRPIMTGTRPFGYSIDRKTIVPQEAELIREATQRIFSGESLRAICWDWGRRGVKSASGKTWRPTSLRRVLTNPATSAQRFYRETMTPGTWPAILAAEETTRLRALLNGHQSKGVARTFLLSGGVARCGRCGGSLIGQRRADGTRRYVCQKQPAARNCGALARVAGPIEDFVRDAICAALEGVNLSAYLSEQAQGEIGALVDAIQQDEEALLKLSEDYYAEQVISRGEFFAARDKIQTRLGAKRVRLGQQKSCGILRFIVDAEQSVREAWERQSLEWRRSLVSVVIDHIDVMPAGRVGRKPFDPSLVRPVWRF
jgi:site-specific DNA recombinase